MDIPADAGAGYGIFECLHGFESPEKLAMTLEHSGSQAYGSPLVGFLEQFTADYEKCVTLTRSFMEDFLSQYQPPDATPQQRRVIRRFAVVAAAGEIAGHLGVTGWQKGEAIRGVAKCLRDWWDDKHGNDRHESDRIITQVHRFIESQGAAASTISATLVLRTTKPSAFVIKSMSSMSISSSGRMYFTKRCVRALIRQKCAGSSGTAAF